MKSFTLLFSPTNSICLASVCNHSDAGNMEITLQKGTNTPTWWKSAIVGEAEVDVSQIEGSQYIDDSLLRRLQVRPDDRSIFHHSPTPTPKNQFLTRENILISNLSFLCIYKNMKSSQNEAEQEETGQENSSTQEPASTDASKSSPS